MEKQEIDIQNKLNLNNSEIKSRWLTFFIFAPIAFIGSLVFLYSEKVKFFQVISPKNVFLLDSLIILIDALLISIIVYDFIKQKRIGNLTTYSRILDTFSILPKSFLALPKVLISYFLLVFFTQASLSIFEASPLPLLFLLVFLVWAPYLVAYEPYSKEIKKEDREDDIDIFDEGLESVPPRKMFSGLSLWKLGFSRSIEFTGRNLSMSVSVVLSIWLAKVLPELLSTIVGDPLSDFNAVLFSTILSWFLGIYLHICIVRMIFNKLDPEEKDELSLLPKSIDKTKKVDLGYVSPFGLRISILVSIALCCSFLWWERQVQLGGLSKASKFKVQEIASTDDELVLTLEITDELRKLRWFSPSRLRLFESKSINKEEDKLEKPSKEINQIKTTADIIKLLSEHLETPSRYTITDINNKPLESYQISPRNEPIKLVVAFPIKKRTKELSPPLFELSYLSVVGFKEVLYTFTPEKDNNISIN